MLRAVVCVGQDGIGLTGAAKWGAGHIVLADDAGGLAVLADDFLVAQVHHGLKLW